MGVVKNKNRLYFKFKCINRFKVRENIKNVRQVGALLQYYREKVCNLAFNDVVEILNKKYNIHLSHASLRRSEDNEREVPILELIALTKIYKINLEDVFRVAELELFDKMNNT